MSSVLAFLILGLQTSAAPVTSLEFTPDGRGVLAASQEGVVALTWPGLRREANLPTQLLQVHDLKFSPGGDRLLVLGGTPAEEGRFEIFAWPNGTLVGQGSAGNDVLYRGAWDANAERFAAGSLDGTVSHFDDEGNLQGTLAGHSRGVSAILFIGSDFMLSAGLDQTLRFWVLSTGELQRTLNNHTQPVHDLALRPGVTGSLPVAVSVAADRTIRFWQPSIGRLMRFLRLDSAEPLAVCWTADGKYALVACTDGRLRVVDPETVELVHEAPAVEGWAYSVAAHPSKPYAVIGGERGQLVSLELPR